MSLLSELFSGDQSLLAAATSDRGHITPGASGPHVAKLQEALNRLDAAKLAVDSQYGRKTAAAVVAFKTKRNIRNSAGKIDEIVGIKTMAALDALLPKNVKNVKDVKDGPAPGPGGAVVIEPLAKPVVLTSVTTDKGKSDLNGSDPPRPALTTLERLALLEVQFDSVTGLEFRMRSELFAMAQLLGLEMFQTFKDNGSAGVVKRFPRSSPLGSAVAAGSDLASVHDQIRLEFDALLKKQFAAGRVNVNVLEATSRGKMQGNRDTLTNPAGVKTVPVVGIKGSLPLMAVIGGSFGGGVVTVTSFTADQTSYEASLRYELIDHFGVDNSDVIFDGFHGTPGQKAFWLLQHRHGPGFKPFITTVVFDFQVSSRWAFRG